MTELQDPSCETIRAQIASVCETYVALFPLAPVGDLTLQDSITVSLRDWPNSFEPERGMLVDLDETHLYARGWRAKKVSPITVQKQK